MTEPSITDLIPDAGWTAPDMSSVTTQYLDVAYASDSPLQKLDLYLPNEGEGPFPVVAFFHGGGFTSGDKRDGQLTSLAPVLDYGYALAAVNYRLAPDAVYPSQIADAKAAIRFLREHATEYNLSDKVVAWGASAGGYIAAFLGTLSGVAAPGGPSANTNNLSNVDAVVDWFAPVDFADPEVEERSKKREQGEDVPPAMRTAAQASAFMYFGGDPSEDPLLAQRIRPVSYVSRRTPPFVVQHGSHDLVVPVEQSIAFAKTLESVLGADKVLLTVLEGARHGGEEFHRKENLDRIFDFLHTQLS